MSSTRADRGQIRQFGRAASMHGSHVGSSRGSRAWQGLLGRRQIGEYDARLVEVHMSNLRRKLAAAGVVNPDIRTVRGVGYRLVL